MLITIKDQRRSDMIQILMLSEINHYSSHTTNSYYQISMLLTCYNILILIEINAHCTLHILIILEIILLTCYNTHNVSDQRLLQATIIILLEMQKHDCQNKTCHFTLFYFS